MKIYVEGIDPSLSNTGIVICEIDIETGTIISVPHMYLAETKTGGGGKKVRKNSDDLRRAREIVEAEATANNMFRPTVVFVEVPTGAQSARAALSNGVCYGFLASIKTPMIEVTPTEVKLASAGFKTAEKFDVVKWAVENFPDADWLTNTRENEWGLKLNGKNITKANEHLADAIAAVAAGIKTEQFKGMLAILKQSISQQ